MKRPHAICFDMDGLMFNTEDVYWKVGTELLRRRGFEFTRELSDAMMGRPPEGCFGVLIDALELPETWQQLASQSEEIFIGLLDEHLAPMRGLNELLEALERAGIPKAICTSSSRKIIGSVIGRFSLEPRFQFTLSAENIVRGKPDPEIYLLAADRFQLEPEEMLVLEDSETGCRSAAAAGAFVVAVPGEHSREQDFGVASLIVDSLADRRLYEAIGIEPG